MKKKALMNEIEVTEEEARNGNTVDMTKCVEFHEIDENKASAEGILSQVKSTRRFKGGTTKGKCKDIRNLLLV